MTVVLTRIEVERARATEPELYSPGSAAEHELTLSDGSSRQRLFRGEPNDRSTQVFPARYGGSPGRAVPPLVIDRPIRTEHEDIETVGAPGRNTRLS